MARENRIFKEFDSNETYLSEVVNDRANGINKAITVSVASTDRPEKAMPVVIDAKNFIEKYGGRVLCLCHQNDILDHLRCEFYKAMKVLEVIGVLEREFTFGMYNGTEKRNVMNGKKVDFLFANFRMMAQEVAQKSFSTDEFAYIIVCEACHATAKTSYQVLKYFNPLYLMGVTETLDRKNVASLSDIFGETVYTISRRDTTSYSWVGDPWEEDEDY